jgi:serine/threonine protein kinase
VNGLIVISYQPHLVPPKSSFLITLKKITHSFRYRAPDVLLGSRKYSTPVDIWSIGCIFAEMINGNPLFTGTSEETQLDTIFRHLGTPDESTFPGISELPDWRSDFPNYPPPDSLHVLVPNLEQSGVELLQVLTRTLFANTTVISRNLSCCTLQIAMESMLLHFILSYPMLLCRAVALPLPIQLLTSYRILSTSAYSSRQCWYSTLHTA